MVSRDEGADWTAASGPECSFKSVPQAGIPARRRPARQSGPGDAAEQAGLKAETAGDAPANRAQFSARSLRLSTKRKKQTCYDHRKAGPAVIFCGPRPSAAAAEQTENTHKGTMHMEIRSKSTDRNLLLEFTGEMDHHGAREAIREMELAIDAALPSHLLLDFAGVTFMDSSGIALLLRAQQRVGRLGGSMAVCHVPQQARRVLDAAGIGRLITIR
jgi:stage II sporulation protein AA (anti-sigma F factor antagonist)